MAKSKKKLPGASAATRKPRSPPSHGKGATRAVAKASGPFVSPNEPNPLGSASLEELKLVVQERLGDDPNLDASETAIAIVSLANAVSARMANAAFDSDPKHLAVFILTDRVRDLAASLGAMLEPIIDNGSKQLAGKLWLTGPNVASGHFSEFISPDPSSVFAEVRRKGLGARPALVFDPSGTQAEIRFYPKGLEDDARVQRFIVSSQIFSLAALDEVMMRHYEGSLKTPDAALPESNPWSDSKHYYPRERAEEFFQSRLQMVLVVAFSPKCRVAFEVRGTEGRCDLMISSLEGAHASTALATLELKVIKSFTSGGRAVSGPSRATTISDGLKQAIAYKNENRAKNGLLCCYDMRSPGHYDGNKCLNTVSVKARTRKIDLRYYRIYGSSKDLRDDKYGSTSGAA